MARKSHRHTRLVNYGQRRKSRVFSFKLWFIIPIAACLAFVTALVLGNILGEIATPEAKSTDSAATSLTPLPTQGGKEINGAFVSLRGITYNTAGEVEKQIPNGATAISMELFDYSGRPFYESSVAKSFGYPYGDLTLKNTFKPIEEGGLYASVLFPSSYLSVTDPNKYASVAAYDATLAHELYLAGADEIVVYFSPIGSSEPARDAEFFGLMENYITAIRMQSKGLRVGIVLSVADLSAYAGSAELERLCATVDFCALDLTAFTDGGALTDALLPLASTALRHEMRLLIAVKGKSEEFIALQAELLQKLGAKNIQYAEINS